MKLEHMKPLPLLLVSMLVQFQVENPKRFTIALNVESRNTMQKKTVKCFYKRIITMGSKQPT